MSLFENGLRRYLSQYELETLGKVRVGIAGAGGLGSNCAHFLARCGFRNFILVDDDRVDASNLNRQLYYRDQVGYPKVDMLRQNLLLIDPGLDIRSCFERVNRDNVLSLLNAADVIVEAFDSVQSKTLLVETFMNSGKLLVTASGIAGWGHPDSICVRQVKENFFMVGDFMTEAGKESPPFAPKVNLVAAKQADIVFQVVLGRW